MDDYSRLKEELFSLVPCAFFVEVVCAELPEGMGRLVDINFIPILETYFSKLEKGNFDSLLVNVFIKKGDSDLEYYPRISFAFAQNSTSTMPQTKP